MSLCHISISFTSLSISFYSLAASPSNDTNFCVDSINLRHPLHSPTHHTIIIIISMVVCQDIIVPPPRPPTKISPAGKSWKIATQTNLWRCPLLVGRIVIVQENKNLDKMYPSDSISAKSFSITVHSSENLISEMYSSATHRTLNCSFQSHHLSRH